MQAQFAHFSSKRVVETGIKLDSNHQALPSDVTDHVGKLLLKLQQPFVQLWSTRVHVLKNLARKKNVTTIAGKIFWNLVALEHVESGACGGARNDVSGIRSSHGASRLFLHQIVR